MAAKRGRSITNFGGFLNPFAIGGSSAGAQESIIVGEQASRLRGISPDRVVGSSDSRLRGIVRKGKPSQ